MAVGMKRIFITKLTDVCTSDKEGVGTRRWEGPNEYIFLKGAASVADGTPVTYNKSYAATVLATGTNPAGPVAIANAAIVASRWGWFQIAGTKTSIPVVASAGSKNSVVYNAKSSAGTLTTTSSGNNLIAGLILTDSESSGAAPVLMDHPFIIE